ncbi:MAG TPA: chemotaxis protein CheW [Xanthobacteraceae bacterium]
MASEAIAPVQEKAQGPAADSAARAAWLICRAGAHLCAVPLAQVIEIMRGLPIEAVAGAPHYVRGLCIIRGAGVPVVDTGLLVGDQAVKSARLITIRAGKRTIALATEEVLGIRSIGTETFNALPPLLREAANETIAAIGTLDAELLFFLRSTRIVSEDLFNQLDARGARS